MKLSRPSLFLLLILLTIFLFIADLSVGSVYIPLKEVWDVILGGESTEVNQQIIFNIRLNKAFVALLAGAALSVSGLQMQTLFRNPLAGPYVLGISSGSSLGVALFILWMPIAGFSPQNFPLGMAGAAWIGCAFILIFIAIAAKKIKDIMAILILGMMFSSGVSAIVQILQYLSHEDALKSFVIWTMGSLGEITNSQLPVLGLFVFLGLLLSVVTIKALNLLLLGEEYAVSMGLNINNARGLLFLSTTLLAGTVTAFCGPIGFIGLAIPHVARMIFITNDHRILVPSTLLLGSIVLLFCDIISKILTLPINSITALLGIPVIIFIVLRFRKFAL